MDFETIFTFAGYIILLCAGIYFYRKGGEKAGLLLILAFTLQLQGPIHTYFFSSPIGIGECIASQTSYYKCLPLSHKISIHASQLSQYILALAIYFAAKSRKNLK